MSGPRCVLLSALALALFVGAVSMAMADRPFTTLEERMTGQEFRETGLHKLTDEELAALNRWIRQRSLTLEEVRGAEARESAPGTAEQASADPRGLSEGSREPIRTRIAGTFRGWDGETEFELQNGMVWRQAERGTFSVGAMENPEVVIRPGMLGSWQLSVEGYNRRVRVERIR